MRHNDRDDTGIDSIFKGLGKFINIVADMMENEEDELDISGNINDPSKKTNIVGKYGVNIRLGADKISHGNRINNLDKIKDNLIEKKEQIEKKMEPAVDIFDQNDKVIVVLEMPGIKEEDIQCKLDEKIIKVRALGNGVFYSKDIKLKFNPSRDKIKTKLNNSIYSIIIDK
ncbi:Hsp20/alpha crystallin family protein [Clostridium sp. ZS2-4]|uniref:Hsp20/alpha crystallin family protein n=1 Tax=Clostridium sp. ZS2-4 TaxID=2987703 RepID=UPI00227B28E7|nr:hypothetical protein [Clostridium sp. ZS2-4]MCY6354431.1 hypothetical protein [Clostridium sp. ZS2-4]